jgi:hypothetical protein
MTDKPTRRRRRLLVPLLGLGVAAWVVRSRLAERRTLQEGWQPLPPRPVHHPAPVSEPADEPAPSAQLEPAEPEPELVPAAAQPVTTKPAAGKPAAGKPAAAGSATRARTVPAAAAVASVAAPALPDAPFGSGSVRANADGSSPDAEHVVKGKTATRVFYAPGSPYYTRTRADVWFRTADDAQAAGFTPRAPRS